MEGMPVIAARGSSTFCPSMPKIVAGVFALPKTDCPRVSFKTANSVENADHFTGLNLTSILRPLSF